MLYNRVINVVIYFKFLFYFKLPAIIFCIFVLNSNYLPLYCVYPAKVGREG